jgi:hypothetical protein
VKSGKIPAIHDKFAAMVRVIIVLIFSAILFSCKSKKKARAGEEPKDFISAVSIIKKDIADVDTSIYSILKIETRNGVTDTVAVPREDFAKYARDFTETPDITSDDLKDDYTESSDFDTLTNKVNISYTTKEPDHEVKNQILNIIPVSGGAESLVETIYIYRVIENDDSIIEKKMTWETGKWFQIVTITQKENAPEDIRKVKLMWTAGPSEF